MSKKLLATAAAVIALAAFLAVTAFAGDKDKAEQGYDPAMMEAWQQAMTPGEHHAIFKDMAGEWNATISMWNAPGTDPVVTEGKSTFKVLYDGRYLLQKSEGTVMGMPHMGTGISGYDNVKHKHFAMWIDNMGTGMMYAEGECTDHCRVITYHTTYPDPVSGKDKKVKMVSRCPSDDEHVLEYYMLGDDGTEFKQMEIVYKRAKGAQG